jgi:hypothetical protein
MTFTATTIPKISLVSTIVPTTSPHERFGYSTDPPQTAGCRPTLHIAVPKSRHRCCCTPPRPTCCCHRPSALHCRQLHRLGTAVSSTIQLRTSEPADLHSLSQPAPNWCETDRIPSTLPDTGSSLYPFDLDDPRFSQRCKISGHLCLVQSVLALGMLKSAHLHRRVRSKASDERRGRRCCAAN